MSKIVEFFGHSVGQNDIQWASVVKKQICPYTGKKCIKTRKSNPKIAIGTCTIKHGQQEEKVIICPFRLIERNQIFMDCLHLLTSHIPGNEIHVVPEVAIPGGNVDYFLVSTNADRKVADFVGIELQTMDTTGTIWPERQNLLEELGLPKGRNAVEDKNYGINWKMTAKTILVQLHHKIKTFESINKHLVLVVQDCLLDYIKREFAFENMSVNAVVGDPMHFHAYGIKENGATHKLVLEQRYSTDSNGISRLLGLNADANIGFEEIARVLEQKISDQTLLSI